MSYHKTNTPQTLLKPLLIHLLLITTSTSAQHTIGINYGTVADNLPPPSQVSTFLTTKTTITKVKIFDSNPNIIKSFSNTNISLTITVPNDAVSYLTNNPSNAQSWLALNLLPFYPSTQINRILIGNEILATGNKTLISNLLPAMKSLHSALQKLKLDGKIEISTPHSLGILSISDPPSSGRFRRAYGEVIIGPILEFHRRTKTPFMICPYPYFGFNLKTLDYALFKPNDGVLDKLTGLTYTNMFDAQMDAVYSAMRRVGYGDVDIVVGETGWPSGGEPGRVGVGVGYAASYNGNLVRHLRSGLGTPLMRNRSFEVFVFSLFNEDLKPGDGAERYFGLFRPDFEPVYDVVGIMRDPESEGPSPEAPSPTSGEEDKKWCIPRNEATDAALQANIDFICGSGVDCKPIQDGGPCYEPANVRAHASYAMNAYYQANGHQDYNCDFSNTGITTTSDPSYEECTYDA